MSECRPTEQVIAFRAGTLSLEGRIFLPDGASRAAVVCHPHPQYGGTMDSSVVVAVVDALARRGVGTLRFNFRGVGRSEGEYSGDLSETEDARAAVVALRERLPSAEIALGGYSFGAMVALLAGHDHAGIDRLFAIALPVPMFDATATLACDKPKLFVVGDRDSYCPVPELEALVERFAGDRSIVRIAGGDHFLIGRESEVAAPVAAFLG